MPEHATEPAWRECLRLYDHLEGYLVFMKDAAGRYLHFNRECLDYFGRGGNEQITGKTDADMSHAGFRELYLRDDREVLETGTPLVDRVELIMNYRGVIRWHLTTKLPVRNDRGAIVGIIGCSRPVGEARGALPGFAAFGDVLAWIETNSDTSISVEHLAGMMNLSLSAFERRFRRQFHMTPTQYIRRVRIAAACRRLLETGATVTEVAYELGYCDQSYFCKEFRRVMGTSPGAYRRRVAGGRNER